jgi:sulfur-oxidizing protein SoxX
MTNPRGDLQMLLTYLRPAGVALLAGVLAACTSVGPKPPVPNPYAKFPCLSYSLPCGTTVATRAPATRELAGPLNGVAERGKEIAAARNKGNCLACHRMKDGTQPGTRGPDLSRYGMLGRGDGETYKMVYDMRARIVATLMPPFGTNAILTDQEIRDVVAYLQSSR